MNSLIERLEKQQDIIDSLRRKIKQLEFSTTQNYRKNKKRYLKLLNNQMLTPAVALHTTPDAPADAPEDVADIELPTPAEMDIEISAQVQATELPHQYLKRIGFMSQFL